jgi:hypothetical protein
MKQNYTVWMDIEGMNSGSGELAAKLVNAMKNSRALVCCITKKYDESPNCQNEICFATSINKPIIVLMFEYVNRKNLKFSSFYIENIHCNHIYRDPDALTTFKSILVDVFLNDIKAALDKKSSNFISNNILKKLPHIQSQVFLSMFYYSLIIA